MNDLFGETDFRMPPKLKYPVNGYAACPGTGPDEKQCKDCEHCTRKTSPSGNKRFYKCRLMKHEWTNGYASDIRCHSPACKEFSEATA